MIDHTTTPGDAGALTPLAFTPLPLGSIKPTGWLRDQLRLQADGLTGHLDELWPDVGPDSAWLGGGGEDWERGPYYCDGLIPLAYLLQDTRLIAKAQHWIDAVLVSQREDGQFGPATNDDWWPRMVMLKVLTQYHEATRDERVLPFMERFLRYERESLPVRPLSEWGEARGAENLLVIYWLYERRPAAFLLELADLVLGQSIDWGVALTEALPTGRVTTFSHLTHVVNVAMGLKFPAVRYRRDGDPAYLALTTAAIAALRRHHGQVTGMFSGDEWLAGPAPTQGVELCAVVELLFSLEQLISISGAAEYGDWLETIAYNALPATITATMTAHQYDQQPNQVLCTIAERHWTSNGPDANIFGLAPHFGCCTANMHQGWPKVAASLWMIGASGGLAVVAYAPCSLEATLPTGQQVVVDEETTYPFGHQVRFTIHTAQPVRFALQLRLPAWCRSLTLHLNGTTLSAETSTHGYLPVERTWSEGDRLEVTFAVEVRALARPDAALGLAVGPLLFALPIGEDWRRIPDSPGWGDWEVYPTTPWNYALAAAPDHPEAVYRLEYGALTTPPFAATQRAIRLHTVAQQVPQWTLVQQSAGPLPPGPLALESPTEEIMLLPYGCSRLRIAEFPCAATPMAPTP